jgi:hypothetical protein
MIPVERQDLEGIRQGLEQIIALSREEMSLAGSIRRPERPREIGIAAATMQKLIDHYLRLAHD